MREGQRSGEPRLRWMDEITTKTGKKLEDLMVLTEKRAEEGHSPIQPVETVLRPTAPGIINQVILINVLLLLNTVKFPQINLWIIYYY